MTRAPANKSAGTTWQALHQHAGDDGFRERSTHPTRCYKFLNVLKHILCVGIECFCVSKYSFCVFCAFFAFFHNGN